jgi:phosphoribosylglycinamide formyltransferase 1
LEKKLVVLASGRGTDFQAIVDHERLAIFQNVHVSALICNHEGAPVIERARRSGVKSFFFPGVAGVKFDSRGDREEARVTFDSNCLKVVKELRGDLVVLAGFDQILGREFVDSLRYSILNIHPAFDLKTYGGKNMVGARVHEMVLKNGDRYSGCSVHYVTKDIDLGPVVLKRRVEILPGETADSLEKRILDVEHQAYPEAIQLVCDDRVIVDVKENRCFVDRYSQNWDIEWESRQNRYLEENRPDPS